MLNGQYSKRELMNLTTKWLVWHGSGDYNDPNTFFDMLVTGANIVATGWSNAKYDNLIKEAANTTDPVREQNYLNKQNKY